jgi:hypothetical protein
VGASLGNALPLYFQPYEAASQRRLTDTKTCPSHSCALLSVTWYNLYFNRTLAMSNISLLCHYYPTLCSAINHKFRTLGGAVTHEIMTLFDLSR